MNPQFSQATQAHPLVSNQLNKQRELTNNIQRFHKEYSESKELIRAMKKEAQKSVGDMTFGHRFSNQNLPPIINQTLSITNKRENNQSQNDQLEIKQASNIPIPSHSEMHLIRPGDLINQDSLIPQSKFKSNKLKPNQYQSQLQKQRTLNQSFAEDKNQSYRDARKGKLQNITSQSKLSLLEKEKLKGEELNSQSHSMLEPSASTHMQSNGNLSFFAQENAAGQRMSFMDDRTDASPSRFSQLFRQGKESPSSKIMQDSKEKQSPLPKQEMIIKDESERQRITFLVKKQLEQSQSNSKLVDWADFINTQKKAIVDLQNSVSLSTIIKQIKEVQVDQVMRYNNRIQSRNQKVALRSSINFGSEVYGMKPALKQSYDLSSQRHKYQTEMNEYGQLVSDDLNQQSQAKLHRLNRSNTYSIEDSSRKNRVSRLLRIDKSTNRLIKMRANFQIDDSKDTNTCFEQDYGIQLSQRQLLIASKLGGNASSNTRLISQSNDFVTMNTDQTDKTLKKKHIQPYKTNISQESSQVKQSEYIQSLSKAAEQLYQHRYDQDSSLQQAKSLFKHLEYSEQHRNDKETLFHKGTIFRSKLQSLNDKLTESISKNAASLIINQHINAGDIYEDESSLQHSQSRESLAETASLNKSIDKVSKNQNEVTINEQPSTKLKANQKSNQNISMLSNGAQALSSPSKHLFSKKFPSVNSMSRYKQLALRNQNAVLKELGIISHLQEERNLKAQLKLEELKQLSQSVLTPNLGRNNVNMIPISKSLQIANHHSASNYQNAIFVQDNISAPLKLTKQNSSSQDNQAYYSNPNQKSLYNLTKKELDNLKFRIRIFNTDKSQASSHHHQQYSPLKDNPYSPSTHNMPRSLLSLKKQNLSSVSSNSIGDLNISHQKQQNSNDFQEADEEGVTRKSYYDKAAVLKGLDKDLSFPRNMKRFKIKPTLTAYQTTHQRNLNRNLNQTSMD